jgi:enamine deaminase RidA (YjgF/YER057c/UK114 family)
MTIEHRKLHHPSGAAAVNVSRFRGTSGVTEWHITVTPESADTLEDHLNQLESGYRAALAATGLDLRTAVWRRFFCSDIANQAPVLCRHAFSDPACADEPCAVSHVGQTPLAEAKVALWACHIDDPAGLLDKAHDGITLTLRRGSLQHLWSTNMVCPEQESASQQTHAVFTDYVARLQSQGLTLADHVIRTWLFQPNIDLDYPAMVATRREFFAAHGLTADTHFIASTGIAGTHPLPNARVFMDAYAVGGIHPGQVDYLAALDHLGPTYDYGVTFERATAVSFRDRKQVFISGTASIDPRGDIVHPGDVLRQLDRTLGNIESLLAAAAATLADMLVFIVYLRDPTDHARVLPVLRERLGDAPMLVLDAPVCRPGWLIEIEGIATVSADHPELPPF